MHLSCILVIVSGIDITQVYLELVQRLEALTHAKVSHRQHIRPS